MNPQKKLGIALMVQMIDHRKMVCLRERRGTANGSSGNTASAEVSIVGVCGFKDVLSSGSCIPWLFSID